jgi:tetratricopeptide (TPR) repeat protein
MSFKFIGKNTVHLFIGLFMLFSFTSVCYGETDYGKLLGVNDRGTLDNILDETKDVLEKNPQDLDSVIRRGIAYHNIAHSRVKGVAKEAVSYLKKAIKIYPDDALLLVLQGSCTTMIGRDSKAIGDKMRFVNEGTGIIDRAVSMAPDNVTVRMVRANNSSGLPNLFKRKRFTKVDMLHIEEIIKKSPKDVNAELQAQVYYRLGKIYKREGDKTSAKSYFEKAAGVLPDSEWGEKARDEL